MIAVEVFFLRLLVAFVAGSMIGFERQWRNKSAGLRTNALVALGSAMYVLLSLKMTANVGDATRIIGQVVTGVGFLGAGVIMHQGLNVQGLTTAATIWCSAALGCLAGAGYFAEVGISISFILFINFFWGKVSRFINRERQDKSGWKE